MRNTFLIILLLCFNYSQAQNLKTPVDTTVISKHKTNFKGVGQPLRIALVGSRFGPGIYNIILSLPKNEIEKRISKAS